MLQGGPCNKCLNVYYSSSKLFKENVAEQILVKQ